MQDEPRRDDRTYWSPGDEVGGRVLDLGATEVGPARTSGKRRKPERPRRALAAGLDHPDELARADEEGSIQRVGGRRRVRPELLLIFVAAAFVVGALVKPWPNPVPPASRSLIAASSPSPANGTAAPTAPVLPPNLPLDAGGGGTAPPDVLVGVPGDPAQLWETVDWSPLGSVDGHAGWGFAAAVLPTVADGLVGTGTATPTTTWSAAGSPPAAATVPIGRGDSAFAIAVTWPAGMTVSRVTFLYLGGPDHPPYLPPAGFPAFTQVSPLPAASVASPASGPAAEHNVAALPSVGTALRSGEYWIPPSAAAFNPVTSSVPDAWQSLPWPWPNGTYRVTVTSPGGATILLLHLQQAA